MPEKRIVEYEMVDATYGTYGTNVSGKLAQGWELHGPPIVSGDVQYIVTGRDRDNIEEKGYFTVHQPMTRTEECKTAQELMAVAERQTVQLAAERKEFEAERDTFRVEKKLVENALEAEEAEEESPF